ncbi:hypothetical protein [Paraburkholderia youngii]|uniref:hypothetical protein n=1 Tax=Paraburkholderia youngii TaxID=2782701 RepID=UPI003D22176D
MTIATDYVPLLSRFLLRRLAVIMLMFSVGCLTGLGAAPCEPEHFGEFHLDLLVR